MTAVQPTPNNRLLTTFLIAAAGTLLITILAITGSAALLVLDRVLRDGPFLLLWIVAAGGYGHWPTKWLSSIDTPRPLRMITRIGLGFGVISLLTLGLGTMGWLNTTTAFGLLGVGVLLIPWYEFRKRGRMRETVLPLLVLGERAGERVFENPVAFLSRKTGGPSPQPSPRVQGEGGSYLQRTWVTPIIFAWLPIIALFGIMLIADCVPPGLLWTDEPHGYDVVEYHLQIPREWYEAGKITPLDHNVFSYLPMNVEMHYLLAMHLRGGPWAGMYLAQMMNGVFILVMILTLLFAVGWPAAMIAAAVPWLTMLGSICYVEAGQLMWATLAIVWLLRSEAYRAVALAGICAGFACGTKLTSLPMLVLPFPIAMLLMRLNISEGAVASSLSLYPGRGLGRGPLSPQLSGNAKTSPHPNPLPAVPGEGIEPAKVEGDRNPARVAAQHFIRGAIFAFVALLVFSPWLIRTFAATGNPIFPEAMTVFGRGPFTEIQQHRWEQSQKPAQSHQMDRWYGPLNVVTVPAIALGHQLLSDFRWGYLLFIVGGVAIRKRFAIDRVIFGAIFLQLLFWLLFTHLQGRFALLMLPVLAIAIGQVRTIAWRRTIAFAAVGMCIIGAVPLLHRLTPFVTVIGVEDFKGLLPQPAADAIDAAQPIALIGDAKAFWYQTPMSKLKYRTVFDVKAGADQSAVDHWLDPADTRGAVRIIDDGELQRLCRTYYGLPKP